MRTQRRRRPALEPCESRVLLSGGSRFALPAAVETYHTSAVPSYPPPRPLPPDPPPPVPAPPVNPGLFHAGTFSGQWHGYSVTFNIQQVFDNRTFNGIGTFTGPPFQGVQFGFAGSIDGDGSLHLTRDTGIGLQHSDAGPPQLINGEFVWQGTTTGVGVPEGGLPFELRL